jgi:hypothetical protein
MWLVFLIVGAVVMAIGVSILVIAESSTVEDFGGGTMLFGFVLMVLAFPFAIIDDGKEGHKEHLKMLHDLRAAGWNVRSDDIHSWDDEVDVACVKLDLLKVNDKWLVAAKRDKTLGGGYNILKSSAQKQFEESCT